MGGVPRKRGSRVGPAPRCCCWDFLVKGVSGAGDSVLLLRVFLEVSEGGWRRFVLLLDFFLGVVVKGQFWSADVL